MESNQKKGVITKIGGGLSLLAIVITIALGWDEFTSPVIDSSGTVVDIIARIVDWFGSDSIHPRWLVSIVLLVVLWNLAQLVTWLAANFRRKATPKCAKYRELWLFFQEDRLSKLPTVLNRNFKEARCGKCMGSIVSTDTRRRGGRINFLKCENGHFVGGAKSYEEYQQQLESIRQRAEQKRVEDLDEGRISQEDFDRKMQEPYEPVSRIGRYVAPDTLPPSTAQEFYDQVVQAFEQQYVKQQLEKIEVVQLNNDN